MFGVSMNFYLITIRVNKNKKKICGTVLIAID